MNYKCFFFFDKWKKWTGYAKLINVKPLYAYTSKQAFECILFFADIKKHTSDDNPDKVTLEKAIESLKEVMT